jgi:hypothetical protein
VYKYTWGQNIGNMPFINGKYIVNKYRTGKGCGHYIDWNGKCFMGRKCNVERKFKSTRKTVIFT